MAQFVPAPAALANPQSNTMLANQLPLPAIAAGAAPGSLTNIGVAQLRVVAATNFVSMGTATQAELGAEEINAHARDHQHMQAVGSFFF